MAQLKYITLDELMASVESDISMYADEGMINRGIVIKVLRKVNEDLGLKLNKEKETVLHIENYKADLPEDFMYMQLALGCHVQHYHILPEILGTTTKENGPYPVTPNAQGIDIEQHEFQKEVNVYNNNPGSCQLNSCGGTYWVSQIFRERTVKYEHLFPLKLTQRSLKFCADDCVNRRVKHAGYDVDIDNGQIVTGFREGKIYINYLADMVDENGNIIILDHPLLTEYYEYAVKKHLLENFYLNNEADVAQKLQYLKGELREARVRALNFVNTVEYTQIQDFYQYNRKRFYNRYAREFDKWWC